MKSFNCILKFVRLPLSTESYSNDKEDALLSISVYAKTKVACEELIKDSNKKFGIDG